MSIEVGDKLKSLDPREERVVRVIEIERGLTSGNPLDWPAIPVTIVTLVAAKSSAACYRPVQPPTHLIRWVGTGGTGPYLQATRPPHTTKHGKASS